MENIKYDALQALRNTQAELTRINFLDVISMMSPNNPLIKDVYQFEENLNELTGKIGFFIQNNKSKDDFDYNILYNEDLDTKIQESYFVIDSSVSGL